MLGLICKIARDLRPVMAMIFVQVAYSGMNVLYKLAANDGMNLRILVAYRLLFSTAFMLPLAFIVERRKRPEFTLRLFLLSFLSGLLGASVTNNLYVAGLALTSATFSTAVGILIPAFTFIMACALGLENLRIGSTEGKAKVGGTLLGIAGAFVFTFYKGVDITLWSKHIDLLNHVHHSDGRHVAKSYHGNHDSILGALVGLAGNITFSMWVLMQAKISKEFGGHYWNSALMSVMGSVQSVAFALCTQRDWKEWKLGWNIRLLTTAYTGIMISGIVVALLAWCIQLRGPLFASIFGPLSLVIVALVGSFALGEKLHLGSIIGTVMIVGGLYMVLWGKKVEIKKTTPTQSSSDKIQMKNCNKESCSVNNLPAATADAHIEINAFRNEP